MAAAITNNNILKVSMNIAPKFKEFSEVYSRDSKDCLALAVRE